VCKVFVWIFGGVLSFALKGPVLGSLEITKLLTNGAKGITLSSEESVSKPAPEIFHRALQKMQKGAEDNLTAENTLHVGDSLSGCVSCHCIFAANSFTSSRDYKGALAANLRALLLRRPGEDYEGQETEDLTGINVISSLMEILHHSIIRRQDSQA
jgi:FMN phosphatase YigB (HAD superfamily)